MKRTIVSAFRPHNQGLTKLFGSLEADIISLIWERGDASARDIFEALREQGQRLSYGAVKTVLDRLAKKQVLERSKGGEHDSYTYRALLDREEFARSAVREIIGSLLASFGEPVYAQFLDQLQEANPDQLERLSRMIDEAEARKKDAQG